MKTLTPQGWKSDAFLSEFRRSQKIKLSKNRELFCWRVSKLQESNLLKSWVTVVVHKIQAKKFADLWM